MCILKIGQNSQMCWLQTSLSSLKTTQGSSRIKMPVAKLRLLKLTLIVLASTTFLYSPASSLAECIVENGIETCTGDQSLGIKVENGSVNTLKVRSLEPNIINTSANDVNGISFERSGGGNVNLHSGESGTNVVIKTGGEAASGISASSVGVPPQPTSNQFLGIPIIPMPCTTDDSDCTSVGVSGGVIQVHSYSDITTTGTSAHGILAQSNTSGYPSSVTDSLEAFDDSDISFEVTSVLNSDKNVGTWILGTMLYDIKAAPCDPNNSDCSVNPDKVTPIEDQTGGKFLLLADGSFAFNPGEDFKDLEEGSSRAVSVKYELEGSRGNISKSNIAGKLVAIVTKTSGGFDIVYEAKTSEYGESNDQETVLPDLMSYRDRMLEAADGAGGSGNSVTVTHHSGQISTSGPSSHGILAESKGKIGTSGRNGGGFWSFGTKKPTSGNDGNPGGKVTVYVDGAIKRQAVPPEPPSPLVIIPLMAAANNATEASVSVLAQSTGGDGGRGGNGGTYYDGRRGGRGGNGGEVNVTGSAVISMFGDYSSGIFALSEGGNGGNGGSGGFVTDGKHGGFGGVGGTVTVEGNWNIDTNGESAHGIWAKSVGGNAGQGGSGGWLAGSPAPGGQATDGGEVTVTSGGIIQTGSEDAKDSSGYSYGIFGQSVGGFGGSGGSKGSIFYTRGGDGGSAGSGGKVSVTNLSGGEVTTWGEGSHAVFAQSVGGGGGSGGGAGALFGFGGKGASGGFGGVVDATNAGKITTHHTNAIGLYAQSVGGSGGDGGYSSGLLAVGGAGSGTSDGGEVAVNNSGIIETIGSVSNAIFGQSIGGGGGNGGSSSGWFSIGGSGGGGGDGAKVTVNNSGELLETSGKNSSVIFAQSVGGGGGNGGNSTSVGSFVSLAIGGKGAAGGLGGDVVVNSSNGEIMADGDNSHGIQAQSIGGGGGNGGFAVSSSGGAGGSISIGIGGEGGGGGDSGSVEVVSHNTISTTGNDADGIFAESIGGGGGNGGFAISVAGSDGFGASFAFGGKGGDGGDGKVVEVTSSGSIDTLGDRSHGIQAQSVGGGGGNGGFSVSVAGGGLGALSLGLGGTGGGGGDSDTVSVESSSAITTGGEESYGLLVQSVGGGGGNGGFNIAAAGAGVGAAAIGLGGSGGDGGDSKSVTVNNQGKIITTAEKSVGLFAQSVGGGGGNGGFSISGAGAGTGAGTLNLGGEGGGGGNSGTVWVDNYGDIYTGREIEIEGDIVYLGTEAHGLLAQSVGGGGGNGGFSITGSGAGTGSGSISVGGFGGDGGNSMGVTVNSYGMIETLGQNAVGLFAQSVGGGGGSGGFSISGSGAGTGAGTFNLGGSGGGGGDSDTVLVDSQSNISTLGKEAHGLFAQSVGGGGGNGSFGITGSGAGTGSGSIGIGGFGGDGGDSKGVTVNHLGEINTEGAEAIGLFAQSVGGGGGSGGFSISGSGAGTGAGTFNLGGAGGGGGDGDSVSVDSFGSIDSIGFKAYGILAQSVGGGGGNGGFSVTGSGAGTGAGSLGIGGFAGDGGDGKAVIVNNASAINTFGHSATGLFAQSVGGGGGTGGFSIAGSGAKTGAGSFSLGGSGGGGGHGDIVTVDNQNSITTDGELAYGVMAQSVGGGGGAGGFSFSGGVTTDGFIMSASVGGAGGVGGNSGSVNLTNDGLVKTTKNGSHAILAQSVGGGGGSGGFSGSLTASAGSKPNISVSVGGSGGVAGDGDNVQLDNYGEIHTAGVASYGLFAQSVGGGGGDGGGSFAVALGKHDGGANLSVSLGGGGGAAGNAENVDVDNDGLIVTEGIKSHGIAAQSIGGGGGNGGFSATGSLNIGDSTKNLAVNIGGSGGGGGDAGSVNVHNTGNIFTLSTLSGETPDEAIQAEDPLDMFKDGAIGILAQSIGGGGGNGGFSFAGSFAGTQAKNLSVSIGGSGGFGGRGLDAVVVNENTIDTTGANSYGILAQSIGGGGGNGGMSIAIDFGISTPEGANQNVAVSVGGEGGDGNSSGSVEVMNSSAISTQGDSSHGILAQSVGGGGGNGGYSLAGTVSFQAEGDKSKQPFNLSMAVGGGGGDGSDGGAVIVENSGMINTNKDGACGILTQSIGGGGGTGGSARALTLDINPEDWQWDPTTEEPQPKKVLNDIINTLNLAIGGNGGGASNGSTVQLINTGDITTRGAVSHAISAQSIGGGGGTGGSAFHGLKLPEWFDSAWLEFTPLKGMEDLQIVVGGSGGSIGNGSDVNVDNLSSLATSGDASSGIFVQSVGGGGGAAGVAALDLVGKIGIGGASGASGDGGDVTVDHDGQINTFGSASYGIFAQSVGGGGGLAGDVKRGLFSFDVGVGLSYAREGGDGGNGGNVAVNSIGSIMTAGEGSTGIIAQSVGGGGGLAGNPGVGLGYAGSVGGQGSAGTIDVSHIGDIITLGSGAHGIFAQSAGGRKGDEKPGYLGLGDKVNVTLDGNIIIGGADADGIIAQSSGMEGVEDITIDVLNGKIQGGSGTGAGVRFLDGADNLLSNHGVITTVSGIDGLAVSGTRGDDTINNDGTIIGSVDLGAGVNTLHNLSGAYFYSGANITLGSGNPFINEGLLSPGGGETPKLTTLGSDFIQSGTGTLAVDVFPTGDHDKLLVADGTASLNGTLSVIKGKGFYVNGTTYDLLEGDITGNFKVLDLPVATPLLSFEVSQQADLVEAEVHAEEFLSVASNRVEIALAAYLDKMKSRATGDLKDALGNFQSLSSSEISAAFSSLSPGQFGCLSTASFDATRQFTQTLLQRVHSVRLLGETTSSPNSHLYVDFGDQPILLAYNGSTESIRRLYPSPEREKAKFGLWLQSYGQWGDQDGADGFVGYDYDVAGIAMGFDRLFRDRFLLGASLGYSDTNVDMDHGQGDGEIDTIYGSLYGSFFNDRGYLDVILTYGHQDYDSKRLIAIGPLQKTARSDHDGKSYSAFLEGGLNFGSTPWVFQPFANLQYIYLNEDGFTEVGAGGLSQKIKSRDTDSLISQLGVRVHPVVQMDTGLLIPEASLAWSYDYDIDDRAIQSSFVGQPDAAFSIDGNDVENHGAVIGAGITFVGNSGFIPSLKYSGEFRDGYHAHGIVGELRWEF
jgi:uncharacterized protein YhjY with autotransporter beta-barrel domain